MSIVLTHAYYLSTDPKEQRIMKPYPPLGQLYISGYLNEHQVENYVFDTTFSSKEAQLHFIASKKPDVVAIYANLMTKVDVIKLIHILKNDAIYGFPKIVLGGPDVTYNCENYLRAGAQYLVIGEGEETMLELYQAITHKKDIHTIPGLAYIDKDKVVKNAARTKIKDLSLLPIPNREAVDMQQYLDTWKNNHGMSSMTISTQRGCPYTCKWCSTAVYGQSYRRRPAHLVAQELAMLKRQYKPDSIWFVDDVFTVSHKWLAAFHEEVMKQDAIIPFECITRAERLNDEVLQQLKEAGCYRIWIGAESGSQKIVDAMDRRVKVETVREAIQKTNNLGIETGTFIMVGYPGEDEKDIAETIHHLKVANPTHFTITVAYPIKGTSLYNEIENDITLQPDWHTSTDRDIDFKRTYHRKFYDFAVRRIVNEVNYFKKKTSSTSITTDLIKLKIKSLLALFAMKYYKIQ
ncbi:radical SAM protein [Aquimarina sp. MMG016]|uniref:B12-binding domain-containing radical SAM protein n=1 Tax=Aquimarina sp. MMG016 TaxID=2822690 RepID=UPI001B3A2E6B|nr:radical SAM protein [Aquimarina sp. MMG016]MBQ4821769.1 B12-binding domain-containing radical SAM protein [Aquimarina sp. MMG016]